MFPPEIWFLILEAADTVALRAVCQNWNYIVSHQLKTPHVLAQLQLIQRVYRYLDYWKADYKVDIVDGLYVKAVKLFPDNTFPEYRGCDCSCLPIIQRTSWPLRTRITCSKYCLAIIVEKVSSCDITSQTLHKVWIDSTTLMLLSPTSDHVDIWSSYLPEPYSVSCEFLVHHESTGKPTMTILRQNILVDNGHYRGLAC